MNYRITRTWVKNDVTIVVFCAVFVVLTKIPVETCKLAIFVSAFVKSATLTQFEPFQQIIFLLVNELTLTSLFISNDIVELIHFNPLHINKLFVTYDVNVASVHVFIEQLDIYVGEILIHLLDDELYCNNWPFDKLLNETSESDDNVVEPMVKVVFIHLLPLHCKTWPFDKLFNETSESPDNVDVKFKVAFIHFPFVKLGCLMQMKY